MTGALGTAVVVLVAAIVLGALRRGDAPSVSRLVWAGFAAHVLGAFAQVYVTRNVYGGGDMIGYYEVGRALSQLASLNPGSYLPELGSYFFQQRVSLPVGQAWEGSSTGSMAAVSTLVVFLSGESLTTSCVLVALWAFGTKLLLVDVLVERLGRQHAARVAFALLLVPSAVFWSSGLLKESVTIGGVMVAIAGAYRVWQGRLLAAVPAALGLLLAAMLKPYVIFPVAAAATVWLYWTRAVEASEGGPVRLRPLVVLLGLGSALGVVIALGRVFPEYAVDRLAEEAAQYQEGNPFSIGGSTVAFGDPSEQSLLGQLAFVPFALVNVALRPFAFEVRNAMMAANALETTALTVLMIVAVVRHRLVRLRTRLMASPELVFCLVLVLTMSVGVGLTTTNLGTLSRYRMPLMPFYALLVLALAAPTASRRTARAEVAAPRGLGRLSSAPRRQVRA